MYSGLLNHDSHKMVTLSTSGSCDKPGARCYQEARLKAQDCTCVYQASMLSLPTPVSELLAQLHSFLSPEVMSSKDGSDH
jgi:hypothetical protein